MGIQQSKGLFGLEHPQLKNATITKDKKLVVCYRYPENFTEWNEKLKSIKRQSPNSLFLPKIQQTQQSNFCGPEKSINLIFEMFPFTLYQQIVKRKEQKQKFTQQELWYLLYQLLQGSSAFQKKRLKSGDIRPKNILINNLGQIKIINTLSFPDQLNNYYKSLFNKTSTYLAPQQLGQLELSAKYCKSDPSLAESFSIGLTVLDAALLFDSQQLYDANQVTFKNYLYNQNLVAFKSLNVSRFFIKTVLNQLEVKFIDRPSPGEQLSILKPYESQILQLKQFVPDRQRSKLSLEEFQNSLK